MSDSETTIDDLRNAVRSFIRERDWEQFHSPKNIAMSIAIEAAELMEHFQWLTTDESYDAAREQATLEEIRREYNELQRDSGKIVIGGGK